jgi:hypothetical protein
MGSVYARVAFGLDTPRVALLSIGEEETKGNELTRDAHRLLKASQLPFIGNIEARAVYSGAADVIVADGFTGNIVLKISEGLVEMVEALLGEELSATSRARGIAAGAAGAPPFPQARRLFRVWRCAPAGRRRDRHRRPWALEPQGRAQRSRDGIPVCFRPLYPTRRARDRRRRRWPAPVIAFIFPGQGSQKVGMGKALAEAFPICRQLFDEADAALGRPLSRLCFEGPDDQLMLTANTQPAILAVSIAAQRLLASRGIEPAFVAGHSLGDTPPTSRRARSRSPTPCAS